MPSLAVAVAVAAASVAAPADASAELAVSVPWTTAGVRDLTIAPDGALWIAGQAGLQRFDGREVVTYDARTAPALKSASRAYCVATTADGAVWAGFGGGLLTYWSPESPRHRSQHAPGAAGLARFSRGAWTVWGRERGLPDDRVWKLLADGDRLWVGTEAGLARITGEKVESFGAAHGIPPGPVVALLSDGAGAVMVGTAEGLCRFREGRCARIHDGAVTSLARDPAGAVWIGTAFGLLRLGADGGVRAVKMGGGAREDVRALVVDGAGALWVGTTAGLFRGRGAAFDAIPLAPALFDPDVRALRIDREGAVWLGTIAGGIGRVARRWVVSFGRPEGLPGDDAKAIVRAADGSLWVLMAEGLARFADGRWTTHPHLPSRGVYYGTLAATPDGAVWVSTQGGGITRVTPTEMVRLGTDDGLPSRDVLGVFADREGALWVADPSGALSRLAVDFPARAAGARPRLRMTARFSAADGACAGAARSGIQLRSGAWLFGVYGVGITRIEAGRASCLTPAEGLPSTAIGAFVEDADGTVWLGARNDEGVVRWRGGRFHVFTEADGLPCDSIAHLVDGGEHLWLACGSGVSRVAKGALDARAAGRARTIPVVHFDATNGMRSQESSFGGPPGALMTPEGDVWVATQRGVAMIPRATHVELPPPVPVVIESVFADGARTTPPVRARGKAVELEVAFRAQTLGHGGAVRFRYRLDGVDRDWVEAGTGRIARYRALPPGRYDFRVMASSIFGAWPSAAVSVPVTVDPLFHQRPVFYAAVAMLLAAIALTLHGLRIWHITRRFRAVADERARLARELHDGLGQRFSAIGFHLDTMAHRMDPADGAHGLVKNARRLLDLCMRETRAAIWELRSGGDAPLDERLEALARGAEQDEVTVAVQGTAPRRDPAIDRELSQVAAEAVTNARRHAGARRIAVTLTWSADRVRLTVVDDGRGFQAVPESALAARGSYGLLGMRERMRKIGGTLRVQAAPGEGTRIEAEAPIAEGGPA